MLPIASSSTEMLAELDADYDAMRPMIFGELPELADVVKAMAELEALISGGVGE